MGESFPELGDVVRLGAATGHDGIQGIVVDFVGQVVEGEVVYRFSVRLPDDSVISATADDFRCTGKSILLFQPDEVVRVVKSDESPELVGAEGIVCGFAEIAPREFVYGVLISHLQEVYNLLGDDLESLGRFETP